ncbi:PAS domain-containing protein [Nannocystis bainbridge]|uniref:PAS domain-containing protein n=1 Tax=Nannocystis bainbridge TaxID=2995303 RepID=A0ABT5ECY5_9BACT|nr:PAS domain-containing protein [Nannocystis bainbridge]MDC0723298.1 PAS domain-containing protein [Nannocystis bainbridge]
MATETQRAALDRMTRALHLSGAAVFEFEDLAADDPLAADAPAFYDERVAALLGHPGDAPPVLGTWLAALHPDERERLRAARRELLLAGGSASIEYRVVIGGATRWWQEQSEAATTRPGRASLVAVVRDITDERSEQEDARRSVELLRQTQAAGAVGGWEVDLVNNTLYWTAETHRLHEVPPGFVPDLATAINFYAPEHVPIISAAVERCMRGEPYDVELEIVTYRGRRRHVQAAGVPYYEDGRLIRLYGIFRDITDLRRREDELRAQIEIIAQQDSAIRQLSTPIIQLWDHILTLPLVGTIDAARAAHIMERLLAEVTRTRARFAILDLTGVEALDDATADHLVRLVRAVDLLGARGALCGLQPGVADSLTASGIELGGVVTYRNLHEALQRCIHALGRARPNVTPQMSSRT